jgi:hypothetical protein
MIGIAALARLALIRNRLDRTGFQCLPALSLFPFVRGLLVDVGMAFRGLAREVGGCELAAEVAIYALGVDRVAPWLVFWKFFRGRLGKL